MLIDDTNLLTAPAARFANVIYGLASAVGSNTEVPIPVESILHTGIKWISSRHMPIVHLSGYAYGKQSPIELKIGFYIYADKIGYCGVTNMGSWNPDVYLFKYTNNDNVDCVAVGLKGSIYQLCIHCNVEQDKGLFTGTYTDHSYWYWRFYADGGHIPEAGSIPDATCVKVPYKADILEAQNCVHKTGNETIAGAKTFSSNVTASGFKKPGGTASQFLKADGSVDSNVYITSASLPSNMSASEITAGTATTARSISAKVLNDWFTAKSPAVITNSEMDAVLEDS